MHWRLAPAHAGYSSLAWLLAVAGGGLHWAVLRACKRPQAIRNNCGGATGPDGDAQRQWGAWIFKLSVDAPLAGAASSLLLTTRIGDATAHLPLHGMCVALV